MSIRLKQLRRQKHWSLEMLAEQTGLTKSYLSKVERGLSVPSIAVALRLARELGADVEELFSEGASTVDIVVTRSSERTPVGTGDGGTASVQGIAAGTSAKKMLPFVLYPAAEFSVSPFKEHDGEELLFVHAGTVEVAFPSHTVQLERGDSLYFNALVPHKLRTVGPVPAEVLVVISNEEE